MIAEGVLSAVRIVWPFTTNLRWQWEQNAYGQEINYMQSLGHDGVVQKLLQNQAQERQFIFGEPNN